MLKQCSFAAGKTILREGDLGETAFVILKGRVQIRSGGRDLATLGPGDTLGEMSMVDDKPRSATAVALEDTRLAEIHRDDFFEALQTDPQATISILTSLFERLREANSRILQLEGGRAESGLPVAATRPGVILRLEPLTSEAEAALSGAAVMVDRFPFRIGRLSHNPLVHNDLELHDETPWQISRHHLALVLDDGKVGVMDRGSTLGSSVDGKRIGGSGGRPGPVFFSGPEGHLVLGRPASPYEFRVLIEEVDGA